MGHVTYRIGISTFPDHPEPNLESRKAQQLREGRQPLSRIAGAGNPLAAEPRPFNL